MTSLPAAAKTVSLSALLAVAFLSAGAFAGGNGPAVLVQKSNVTVIAKTSAWPRLAKADLDICAIVRCIEA